LHVVGFYTHLVELKLLLFGGCYIKLVIVLYPLSGIETKLRAMKKVCIPQVLYPLSGIETSMLRVRICPYRPVLYRLSGIETQHLWSKLQIESSKCFIPT